MALWVDQWPLLTTCAFALASGLWVRWATGDSLSALLLAVPASCGVGYLMSRLAGRNP